VGESEGVFVWGRRDAGGVREGGGRVRGEVAEGVGSGVGRECKPRNAHECRPRGPRPAIRSPNTLTLPLTGTRAVVRDGAIDSIA